MTLRVELEDMTQYPHRFLLVPLIVVAQGHLVIGAGERKDVGLRGRPETLGLLEIDQGAVGVAQPEVDESQVVMEFGAVGECGIGAAQLLRRRPVLAVHEQGEAEAVAQRQVVGVDGQHLLVAGDEQGEVVRRVRAGPPRPAADPEEQDGQKQPGDEAPGHGGVISRADRTTLRCRLPRYIAWSAIPMSCSLVSPSSG